MGDIKRFKCCLSCSPPLERPKTATWPHTYTHTHTHTHTYWSSLFCQTGQFKNTHCQLTERQHSFSVDIVAVQHTQIMWICVFLCVCLHSILSKLLVLKPRGTKTVDKSSVLLFSHVHSYFLLLFLSVNNCTHFADD